eukprot:TRINITY_DN15627_c0_g1_i1.p1 TRINITY_DN15627_c0_g1~~TRINITY_DN15627_c0_g1_i1.p1  ORF type:complete len:227 (-),score=28.43 TRINITY_DN15627_c0_g1_i1:181-810(-)
MCAEKVTRWVPQLKQNHLLPLRDLCLRSISDNIDQIEGVGDLPTELLDKVLHKCTVEQLIHVEETSHRRDLKKFTDRFWKNHCKTILGIEEITDEHLRVSGAKSWRILYASKKHSDEDKKRKFSERARQIYKKEENTKSAKSIKVINPPPKAPRSTSNWNRSSSSSSSGGGGWGRSAAPANPTGKGSLMAKSLKDLKTSKSQGFSSSWK